MCIFISLCRYTSLYISLSAYMVYIDRYIDIYKCKYIHIHIQVRQQLEYTLKSKTAKKSEKRDPLVTVGITNRD
jgi:hypothetical protein